MESLHNKRSSNDKELIKLTVNDLSNKFRSKEDIYCYFKE